MTIAETATVEEFSSGAALAKVNLLLFIDFKD
jgi:hypothetical protein